MSIVLSTLSLTSSDPASVASVIGLGGAVVTWLVLQAFDQGLRH